MRRRSGATRRARIAALAALVLVGGCALFYRPPDVRIVGLRVAALGFSSGTAELDLEVRNDNRGDVKIRGFQYRLDVRRPDRDTADADGGAEAWALLGEGFHSSPTTLPSGEATRITVEVPFEYEALGAAVRSLLREGEVRYRLQGRLRIDGALGEYDVPLRTTGALSP